MTVKSEVKSPSMVGALRVVMLALLAMVIGVLSVSFASKHMRQGFEGEYKLGVDVKIRELAILGSSMINGDDIIANPQEAGRKYERVLSAAIVNTTDVSQCIKFFALYAYSNGELIPLCTNSPSELTAASINVSDWLTAQGNPYELERGESLTILTPIRSSDGSVVGLYEFVGSYHFLKNFGSTIEQKVLVAALISLSAGLVLFSLHYLIPALIMILRKNRKGGRVQ